MKLKISGVPPYDGEYPLDIDKFTNRDYKTIKDMSGYTPMTLIDAFRTADMAFFAALGVVAARRSGRHGPIILEELFWEAEAGTISLVEEADDALNPTTPEAPTTSTLSGEPGTPDGDVNPARILRATGTDSSAS